MAGRVTEEMVARIQAGEHDVWNDLYKHYRDALLLTVRCRLGPRLRARLDSEDILQSVFGDALRELDRFEWRGEGSLRHFLGTLVTHKVRNHVRKLETKKRKGEVPLTGGIEAVPDRLAYQNKVVFDRLDRCIRQLPEDMAEVVLLRKIEGLSSQEAGEILGKTDAAVRKIYSRAMKRLASLMTETNT